MFQKVFPTLLRPDFFHPPGFLGFTCGAMPPWNPEAQASFLGHLWYLGWEKNPKNWRCFSPCWFISSLCWGVTFPTRQDATVKYCWFSWIFSLVRNNWSSLFLPLASWDCDLYQLFVACFGARCWCGLSFGKTNREISHVFHGARALVQESFLSCPVSTSLVAGDGLKFSQTFSDERLMSFREFIKKFFWSYRNFILVAGVFGMDSRQSFLLRIEVFQFGWSM